MDFLKRQAGWVVAFALAVSIVVGYRLLFSAPADFPAESIVSISKGSSAPAAAELLADAHIVANPFVLRSILRLSGTSGSIHAGAYRFTAPQNVFAVAFRLVAGDYGFPPVRLTFPEGTTVREMATHIEIAFPEITAGDFITEAKPREGYLFPDTYLFSPASDAASVVAAMRTNFDAKTTSLLDEIRASEHSLSDIVIMASLLEKEARTAAVRRMVSGILWNRLARGMPLQVDAVFGYIFERDTYSPSYADLKVNSPYNTYTHTGLPPGAIGNPGLDSFDAALHPAETDYLYYLTDKDGVMHYAATYAGHQANQRKYLK